jgi:hypothetical protein
MPGVAVIPGELHADTAVDLFGPVRGHGDTSVPGRACTTVGDPSMVRMMAIGLDGELALGESDPRGSGRVAWT